MKRAHQCPHCRGKLLRLDEPVKGWQYFCEVCRAFVIPQSYAYGSELSQVSELVAAQVGVVVREG